MKVKLHGKKKLLPQTLNSSQRLFFATKSCLCLKGTMDNTCSRHITGIWELDAKVWAMTFCNGANFGGKNIYSCIFSNKIWNSLWKMTFCNEIKSWQIIFVTMEYFLFFKMLNTSTWLVLLSPSLYLFMNCCLCWVIISGIRHGCALKGIRAMF